MTFIFFKMVIAPPTSYYIPTTRTIVLVYPKCYYITICQMLLYIISLKYFQYIRKTISLYHIPNGHHHILGSPESIMKYNPKYLNYIANIPYIIRSPGILDIAWLASPRCLEILLSSLGHSTAEVFRGQGSFGPRLDKL